jgi:hypothetical protein
MDKILAVRGEGVSFRTENIVSRVHHLQVDSFATKDEVHKRRIEMGEPRGTQELLYEYICNFTQVVEYGMSVNAILSGQVRPPVEGARFDVYFEGPLTGPKMKGTVKGVDYLHIRADGRCQLNLHAEITTEDGKKIALAADGVAIPEAGSPIFQLRENVTLLSNYPEYSWLNAIQVWAPGTVDVSKGEIRIKGYAA